MPFISDPQPVRLMLAARAYDGFSTETSHWTRYEVLREAGITAMTGILEIEEDPKISNLAHVSLFFDPLVWPTERYGLAYGDDMLETSIRKAVGALLGVAEAPLSYTEQGMQGAEYVSLEGGQALLDLFRGLSGHQLLALTRNPAILCLGGPFGCFELPER